MAASALDYPPGRPPRAPGAADGSPCPLFRLVWVLGLLLTVLAALLAADLHLYHLYDKQGIHYNRHGYRGHPLPAKAPGEYRVTVFGGSGAFGYGQAQANSLPVVLEEALHKQAACPVRVINLTANE